MRQQHGSRYPGRASSRGANRVRRGRCNEIATPPWDGHRVEEVRNGGEPPVWEITAAVETLSPDAAPTGAGIPAMREEK